MSGAELNLLVLAYRLADRWAVVDVERCDFTTGPDGTRWYDLRHLLNPHEHPAEHIDWHRESVQWLLSRGLLVRHPETPHLARLVPRATGPITNPQPRS